MTKEEQERLDYQINVMQAYKEGAEIEYMKECLFEESWVTTSEPAWNWSACDYRIKPKPKYRPYKNAQEFLKDLEEHKMYIFNNGTGEYLIPTSITNKGIEFTQSGKNVSYSWGLLFIGFKWQDKTPCGIKE